ncbi:hypothetical protein MUK72_17015 (plasmid) [Halococcus dombrowskii]|uniref:Uncharacterized protein n=1 Tax=Halococcus dombrowskii TaxID=179637 RepID=A0AAV3SC34_HALDO|nr:hypothetical protein [Halococcus dombrowskii]UOO96913.1 hypothetical protein MUK72_17015 [Halococcus dombrowskii]
MSSWKQIELGGKEIQLMIRSSNTGEFEVGSRYSSNHEEGYLALLKEHAVCWYQRPSEPRSVGVSDVGDAVVADWIEYGESTGATISVIDREQSTIYEKHLDVSAPTVDISPDSNFIVLCPYGELARILDIRSDTEIVRHEYDIADRLIPSWITVDGDHQVEFRQKTDDDPLYRIDFNENITWSSDSFESRQYYQVVTLDETVPWTDTIEDFASDYAASDDAEVKHTIANTIGEARLVDANRSTLQEVVSALTRVQSTFVDNEAHQKLVSQLLGEAYYRLAKDLYSGLPVDEQFWELIEQSAAEYRTVLPWYEGKRGLSKALRLQANQYTKQNRTREALSCYEQIELLESRYNVSLLSTGDTNSLKEYRQKNVSAMEPNETGKLIQLSQLPSYE